MKKLHHKGEKKSPYAMQPVIAQSLVWRAANRLRKNLCQDLFSEF
ncbi:hypothetical protein PU683_00635 [Kosakonia cowanii]|nr:hypothetical protein [Kosakonia cowanii]MDF7758035.1 hypothetical protein [Kosakonia cowanii]